MTGDDREFEQALKSGSPTGWAKLIEAVGPASLLVVIEARMGAALRDRLAPEDILQDALMHAWRDRSACEWRGLKAFRAWILTLIDRRLHDAADYLGAQKRGGGVQTVRFGSFGGPEDSGAGRDGGAMEQAGSTTPSRVALHREQAVAMLEALQSLPVDVREVVRLRLFEQREIEEVARLVGIGASAVRHRLRKGVELYQRRLVSQLGTRTAEESQSIRALKVSESSPSP